jgi:hypothetical protein
MIWHREYIDIVECVTHAQRSRRAINDLAERNADGADINNLTESLLLTEKKYTKPILVRNRLILVPYELPFDSLNNHSIATVLYKSYYKRSASINNTNIIMSFTDFNIANKDKISSKL